MDPIVCSVDVSRDSEIGTYADNGFREEEEKEQASPSRCYNYSIKVRRSHGARFVTSFAPSMTESAGDR